jgi:hypothetical protein
VNPAAIALGAVISGIVGAMIGSSKGKSSAGFLLGLFLGPIGWIIAAVMTPSPEVEAAHRAAVGAAMPGGANSRYEQLDRLTRLHDSGAISDDEYEDQKARVPPADLEPGWKPDPFGRHTDRHWDGKLWTQYVRTAPGVGAPEDPI